MLILTGNGRLTRDVELRTTHGDDSVTTVSVASNRRGGQAEAAAEHLVKGQAVAFSGRFEPRTYTTRDGREGVAYEGVVVAAA